MNNVFEDVKTIIENSQGIENPKLDRIEKMWRENKKRFIDAFGGLSYTVPEPVTFELDEGSKSSIYECFCSFVSNTYDNYELDDFLFFVRDAFFENKVPENYNREIHKGMKIIKAFKHFHLTDAKLRELQDKASMLIQENKVSGYLTISVNPLDFLSMSVNEHCWTSCQSLEGMYRDGILSLMTDKSSVVCFLSSKNPMNLYGTEFSNKKWRVLLNFSENDNFFVFSRQYPFDSKSAPKIIKEKIIDKIYGEDVYCDPHHVYCKDVRGGTSLSVPLKNLIVKSSRHYNDYKDLSFVWYSERHDIDVEKEYILYGNSVPCIKCGKMPTFYEEINGLSYTMMCDECELEYGDCLDEESIYYCESCGSPYTITTVEDTSFNLCQSCYESGTFVCDCCGERYDEVDYGGLSENGEDLCRFCYQEESEEE